MDPSFKLVLQELTIPWGSTLPFKARLYAATPSCCKSKEISDTAWCTEIISLAAQQGKICFVISDSFWLENGNREVGVEVIESKFSDYIRFHDLNGGATNAGTPQECLEKIVEDLKSGKDIAVLFSTTQISGFIPALISMLAAPDCHLEKILWPIEHSAGYFLTPAQRGYLAGLFDANKLRALGLAASADSYDE